jgi:hypothetical protein
MTVTLFSARFNIYLILERKPHIIDILTRFWASRSEIRFQEGKRDFPIFKTVFIDPGIHPSSYYTRYWGSFCRDRAAVAWSWLLISICYQGDEWEGLYVTYAFMPFVEFRGITSPWLLRLRFQSKPHHRLAVVTVAVGEWRRKAVHIVNTCSDNSAVGNVVERNVSQTFCSPTPFDYEK